MITQKWKADFIHPQDWRFLIMKASMVNKGQGDRQVDGFFLYVTDKDDQLLFDHMQDKLEIAQKQALRKWGVPLESWTEVPL